MRIIPNLANAIMRMGRRLPIGCGSGGAHPVPPSNTAAPTITGTPQVGQTQTASTGTWAGDSPITYEYRWSTSADGATGWAIVSGATAATFSSQAAQQGLYLSVEVRATNPAGQSGWVRSAAAGPVAAALAAPTRISAPTVAGAVQVGQTLTIDAPAVYSGNPTPSITYRWQVRPNGGGTISVLATGVSSFVLTSDQLGMQIRVQDMAINSQGSTGWATGAWLGPVAAAPTGPTLKAGTLTNPPFGMLLNWDGPDANNNNPFVDWLKLGSEWQASGATQIGWDDLVANGHISDTGSVLSIPAGADNVTMKVLGGIPAGVGAASGRYRLYFTGDGDIGFSGAGAVDWPATGQAEFNYTADGNSFVMLMVGRVDTGSITFNALVHEDDWTAYENGETFRRDWLDLIRNNRVLRFTDWMGTDYRTGAASWATRYTPGRITYQGGDGVPVEVMCHLCNEIGADPWFSLLSGVDDTYVTAFATAARATLDAERHAYVELSNKIWDGANWATANYFRDLALDWFSDGGIEACMEAYGGRSSEVFDLWRAVWSGGDAARVHTVLQAWTPNAYISEFAMTAPRWVELQSGRVAPYTKATEWALHANLDGGMRYEDSEHPDVITTIQGWIDTLPQSDVFSNMADAMINGNPAIGSGYTMAGLASAYSDQKNLLAYYGNTMNPICYEGGSHLAVPPSKNGDAEWVDTFVAFHQSAQWADVWSDSITETWYGAFGPESFYVRKNDIRLPDANNGYGLMRWAGDTTGNLQLAEWQSLQSARNGETGRGADDFIGTYEEME